MTTPTLNDRPNRDLCKYYLDPYGPIIVSWDDERGLLTATEAFGSRVDVAAVEIGDSVSVDSLTEDDAWHLRKHGWFELGSGR